MSSAGDCKFASIDSLRMVPRVAVTTRWLAVVPCAMMPAGRLPPGAGFRQLGRNVFQARETHVEHRGGPGLAQGMPIRFRAAWVVTGHEAHAVRVVAVR